MNIIGVDRISDLPDEVLSHILSLLSTKEAVQTCILAKRWRKTWAFMPVLKFSLAEFLIDIADINNYEKRKECEDKLKQFVNGVLENRGPYHLDVFQYQSDIDGNHSEVSFEWLDNVALLMPRVIEVVIARDNAVDFPDSIFSCGSLQELSLDILNMDDITFIRPKSINLPSLKILELIGITLEDDFTQKLFSGCPALESLLLCHCDLEFSEISSNVLKKLDLLESWHRKKMQISCPHMDSLVIVCENQEKGISLENMVSLVSAEFSLSFEMFDTNSDMNLLSGLSNVSTLTLDLCNAEFKEILEDDILNCQTFNNLKSLETKHRDVSSDFDLVACFLLHSPCLQDLTLNLHKEAILEEREEELREVVFWQEHLVTIRILKSRTQMVLVDQLINNLFAHILKYYY